MAEIHPAAAKGYAQGAAAYVEGRPDYPPAIDGWLRATLDLGPGRRVVDLGAGTGKFTPCLTATGAQVIAVEPVAAMRAELALRLPEVEARVGTAEAMPLPDASVDAVVCAQSFHWFANARALGEIARVIRPGGRLGLVWNVRDDAVPWVGAFAGILNAHEGNAPRYKDGRWRGLFPADGFGPLEERRFPHSHRGSAEQVLVARALSTSFIAALPAETRAEVESQVRALVSRTPQLTGRAEITVPYETCAYACRRL